MYAGSADLFLFPKLPCGILRLPTMTSRRAKVGEWLSVLSGKEKMSAERYIIIVNGGKTRKAPMSVALELRSGRGNSNKTRSQARNQRKRKAWQLAGIDAVPGIVVSE